MIITTYKQFLLENKVDTDTLLNFISSEKGVNTYLHTCKTEELCKKIFEEGFEFVDFYKTTDSITTNKFDLDWKLSMRQAYGDYTLIIQIKIGIKDLEALTTKPPHQNENEEEAYTLPREFVRAYYNRKTGEIVKNPHFNLNYDKIAQMSM
jgi:hypothetical protein